MEIAADDDWPLKSMRTAVSHRYSNGRSRYEMRRHPPVFTSAVLRHLACLLCQYMDILQAIEQRGTVGNAFGECVYAKAMPFP